MTTATRSTSAKEPWRWSSGLPAKPPVMAHAKLRTMDDVDADVFADWLAQARGREQA